MWQYTGKERPPFAEQPSERQESVWDFPRPPALVGSTSLVEVHSGDTLLASTRAALRVLETASPPTYYLPRSDVDTAQLVRTPGSSYCEWKGVATYWVLASDPAAGAVGWSYDTPSERFAALAGWFSFYPGRVACFVDAERVTPQPGSFYGGWMTSKVAGPVKGSPGTGHW